MSTEDPIAAAISAIVAKGELAGAATLVWRGGKVIQSTAIGRCDLETDTLVAHDTIFRIASMTKPITSVAALMLFDEGRFALDDPITLGAGVRPDARPALADRPPGRHRAGGAGDHHGRPSDPPSGADLWRFPFRPDSRRLRRGPGRDIDSTVAPDDWIAGLAALPLIGQPGAAVYYGHSTDLLGLLIARMENASLGEVLQRRIFGPLGMQDSGFVVPKAKWNRRAGVCGYDEAGRPTARLAPGGAFLPERPEDMTYVSGGAGLWSTVDDYLAFARTFVGDGEVDGVRLLKPETINLMRTNQLAPEQRAASVMLGTRPFAAGHGFGLGVAVVMEPDKAPASRCKGGVGTVGWPGAYGGWWQADPTTDTVMIFLTHNMFDFEQLMQGIGLGAFAAVEQFHALASAM